MLYFFSVAGSTVGIVLLVSLVGRRENRPANRILGLTLVCMMLDQGVCTLQATGDLFRFPLLIRAALPLTLAVGPLLYLYIRSMTEPGFALGRKQLVHLLPVVLGISWYVAIESFGQHPGFWQFGPFYRREYYCRLCVVMVITGFYLVAGQVRLGRWRREMREYFSELSKVRLSWLSLLSLLFGILWGIAFADVVVGPDILLWGLLPPALTCDLILMAIFALRQSSIFSLETDWRQAKEERRVARFDEAQLARCRALVTECMEKKRLFLNPELRLSDLADGMGVKPHLASALINSTFHQSFFELVNRYRVEEAKRRMVDPAHAHLNLLGIASDSGFNSKSTFNLIFKKYCGMPPSVFRTNPSKLSS